jgi:hypothetical protein
MARPSARKPFSIRMSERTIDRLDLGAGRASARRLGACAGSAPLRLLVDEMHPPSIAEQLRDRGHDIVAVTERAEPRALPDDDVFATAQRERRAVGH